MSERLSDAWDRGSPYEQYIGRWSRLVAPEFLGWLDAPVGLDWLDIGCGTGALSAAILENCAPASVTGVEPSDGFREVAAGFLGKRVRLLPGTASAIPVERESIDVAVSGLVFNFVPDEEAALGEMSAVCRAGGVVAAYVWDYAHGMQFLRAFWDAAVELDPGAAQLDEGVRFPVCREGALADRWRQHGLTNVSSEAIEIPTRFRDFDDFWEPFLGGQGPAPTYVASLDPDRRTELASLLRSRLAQGADGSISLSARAWAVKGHV